MRRRRMEVEVGWRRRKCERNESPRDCGRVSLPYLHRINNSTSRPSPYRDIFYTHSILTPLIWTWNDFIPMWVLQLGFSRLECTNFAQFLSLSSLLAAANMPTMNSLHLASSVLSVAVNQSHLNWIKWLWSLLWKSSCYCKHSSYWDSSVKAKTNEEKKREWRMHVDKLCKLTWEQRAHTGSMDLSRHRIG